MKKIGIYGGSFDPLHNGHINLALEVAEIHHLDEIWFIPAQLNPHKINSNTTSATHRFNMLNLALQDIPNFKVLDIELLREGPSYTIDTLKELAHRYSSENIQFYLIIGDDSIEGFSRWKEPNEICKIAKIIVGRRLHSSYDLKKLNEDIPYQKSIKEGLTKTSLMEISGTAIRKRLFNKSFCGHLLPAKVLDYISEHHLY